MTAALLTTMLGCRSPSHAPTSVETNDRRLVSERPTLVHENDDTPATAGPALNDVDAGTSAATPAALPLRTPACESNNHSFALMPFEVTVNEYRGCVAARSCTPARGRQRKTLPVVGVTKDQAAEYCAFIRSRLPTDNEWLDAARADCSEFPWGQDAVVGASNCILTEAGYSLMRPGSRPRDVVRGMYDLHGNALEWTSDDTVRGARFCSEPLDAHQSTPAEGYGGYVGFRCIQP